MVPLVATETFCRNARCLAANSGSLSRDEDRLEVVDEVDEEGEDEESRLKDIEKELV